MLTHSRFSIHSNPSPVPNAGCSRTLARQSICTLVMLGGIFLAAQPAFAYGDLTSASYLCQMILGTIFGGTFSILTVGRLFMDGLKRSKPAHVEKTDSARAA